VDTFHADQTSPRAQAVPIIKAIQALACVICSLIRAARTQGR
jgi:hypothetical protein